MSVSVDPHVDMVLKTQEFRNSGIRENVKSFSFKREAIQHSLLCEVNFLHFGNCHAETEIPGTYKEGPSFSGCEVFLIHDNFSGDL